MQRQIHIKSAVITSSSFTSHEEKDTFTSPSLMVALIALLFKSFEVARALLRLLPNISPFSNQIKPNLFETLSNATESNAQRNKRLSLQATTSSGLSYLRKTHLKWREVVMI